MAARHPQGFLRLFLTIVPFFTLLVTVPRGFAQETMEPQVSSFAGMVSGMCFHDANGNGMLDAAEGGIAGITLSLKAVHMLTRQTEIITTMSNEGGKYEFIGLSRGVYRLEAQNTAQWVCSSQNPQRVVVASFITGKAINVAFQKPVVQDSFVLSEFLFNSMDTHMYWDGTYLWLPETEYLTSALRFNTNLIRLNPDDFSYTRYDLPPVDYDGRGVFPIVYEVVPSPSNSDILYISAPYGQPKSLYVFHQSSGEAYGYRLINEELVYGGNNGARMAVTTSGGNDTVWITCNDSKIATFDVASAAMTELHDFSGIAPGGLYGIAAVPAATGERHIIHVASFGGRLLIFPSDLTSVSQSITIDLAEYGVSDAVLMALIYDEPYIWVAGHGNYRGTTRLFIMRYMPGAEFDMAGECTIYWSQVSTGMVPSLVSYGNWVFAVVEHMDCSARELIRLNKSTGAVDDFEIQFQNPRVAASLGHDDKGNIYVGGFGCSSEYIRPLELVRFTNAAAQ